MLGPECPRESSRWVSDNGCRPALFGLNRLRADPDLSPLPWWLEPSFLVFALLLIKEVDQIDPPLWQLLVHDVVTPDLKDLSDPRQE
jgi:hypothetical protein